MSDARWDEVLERARGEVREGRPLTELLDHELDARERDALRHVGLVLLRPDSLAAGQGAAIIAHLTDDLEVQPLALRVLPALPPALIDAAYHRQPKIPRSRIWLQHEALRGGPAAAVLVASTRPREPDLTAWLYARKGPTSTLQPPERGSLRQRFGRASSLHAVIHIPEDLPALVAETSLFFPWEAIRTAAAALAGDPESIPSLPARVVAELVTLEPLPGRSVFQAALKVKLRIAAALAVRVSGASWLDPLRDLTAEADSGLEGVDYLGQRDRMLAFAAEERGLLEAAIADLEGRFAAAGAPAARSRAGGWRAVREAVGPLELASASWFLSGHEAYGGDGGERLFAALEAHDVPLSVAQRGLLAAALAYDLHPGARIDGERVWPLGDDPGGDWG